MLELPQSSHIFFLSVYVFNIHIIFLAVDSYIFYYVQYPIEVS